LLNHIHDLFEILMMSLALGMDAFSLAIGLGLQGVKRDTAWQLVTNIGLAHVFMASGGLVAGMVVQGLLGQVAQWFSALLLIGLGLHMVYSTLFSGESDKSLNSYSMAIPIFALTVSFDALSVGFSLGLRSTAFGVVSVLSFGLVGSIMCVLGLWLGKRVTSLAGKYGELFGAAILIGFGLHFLMK
jgi:putative Mn2+ efflux pump MntP